MSSFGFGNNNSGSSGFGGFGSTNTGGGFGANNNTSSGGTIFGGNTATAGGFGTGTGGGSSFTPRSIAQTKPVTGFGASTSAAPLFGSNTSTSGGFGFGANNNAASTSTGFGASTAIFGNNQNKATGFGGTTTGGTGFGGATNTFGAANTTTSNPFASASTNTTSTFGANNTATSGGFGFGTNNAAAASNNNNGTNAGPFQAVTEKDGTTNSSSSYQSITFQDPYKLKSFEELRVEDYLQGRRYGNSNGQAGTFGQSTGFGGFNSTNNSNTGSSNLFNNNSNTTTTAGGGFAGFGASTNNNNNSASGFGNNNTGGGLFNKPGGLFGTGTTNSTSTPAFGATATGGGGLFGAANNQTNNTTGFGANTSNTGSGLFGANNNATQNNAFGASNANTGTSLFGQNNNQNKPGLFGTTGTASTGGGLFGQNNQNQSNPFGQSNTTNAGNSLFNTNNNNQAKPAFGGFGATTNTGTGFGNNNASTGTSLFGANNTTNNSSNLFGNTQNQNKPSLFPAANNNGGGLFGATNNTNQASTGLFGAKPAQTAATGLTFGNNTQAKPLFGTGNATLGNSIFGNNQNQPANAGSSLFGNTNSTNNNAGNSLWGNNGTNQQQQNQNQQTQNQLHASLTVSPYGNDQLFSTLGAQSPPVGPLATPLHGARPTPRKSQSLLGSMRVNSPVYTPRASAYGRTAGYGLSYSNYGTPNSSFSGSLTPGASSLLRPTGSLGSALTGRLSKSFSTSNLRGDGTPDNGSLLRSAPLTPGSVASRYGGSSMRKLRIDRSLREDFWSQGVTDKTTDSRKVNFDDSTMRNGSAADVTPSDQNALVTTEEQDGSPEQSNAGLSKQNSRQSTSAKHPEMDQVNGAGALTTVPENGVPSKSNSVTAPAQNSSPTQLENGDYWSKPSIAQLKKMSPKQLEKLGNFTVGRHGYGQVVFKQCDLTSVPFDDICGGIVTFDVRHATVYPLKSEKPPVGQGLNVPAIVSVDKSWPKAIRRRPTVLDTNSHLYQRHMSVLQDTKDTKFVSYDQVTGTWTFEVEHFTTYGLDDDDQDDEMMDDMMGTSDLSDAPTTPENHEDTMQSIETMSGDVDDTFQFKLDKKLQSVLPGAFDLDVNDVLQDFANNSEDFTMAGGLGDMERKTGFSAFGGPVQPPSPASLGRIDSGDVQTDVATFTEHDELSEDDTADIPGAFLPEMKAPRSILKPTAGFSTGISHAKLVTASWEDQLQRTMSPAKRDRRALRDMQQSLLAHIPDEQFVSPFKQSVLGRSAFNESYLAQKSAKKDEGIAKKGMNTGISDLSKSVAFTTSMDIMNSLWANDEIGKKAGAGNKDFENPLAKKPRLSDPDTDKDSAFHASLKPKFNPSHGILTYAAPGSAPLVFGELVPALQPVVGEHRDVRFARFAPALDMHSSTLAAQRQATHIAAPIGDSRVPAARLQTLNFRELTCAIKRHEGSPPKLMQQEGAIWQLCSILFDSEEIGCVGFTDGLSQNQLSLYKPRIKLESLCAFWSKLVAPNVEEKLSRARTPEERALLYLTEHNIGAACEVLAETRDYRLATMVAQLPGSVVTRNTMRAQIEAWRKRKDWSEMSESMRAMYCLLAGIVCTVPGQEGASEDRAGEFCITETFNLTWQQSFALTLFYGGHATVEAAIQAYCDDVDSEAETVFPTTLWDKGFEGNEFADKEDTLVGILRLAVDDADKPHVDNMLDPLTISGSALNSRLAWQLATLLQSNGVCKISLEKLDSLTVDFAAELEVSRDINGAAWVLLHMSDEQIRHNAINGLLQRNGNTIFAPDQDGDAQSLVEDLHIPASLVWAAKATSAAHHDEFHHITWLMMAHSHNPSGGYDAEAHEALCTTFAPQSVIAEDYERLAQILERFGNGVHPQGWEHGGEVYSAFVQLMNMRPLERQSRQGEQLVRALRRGLVAMEEDGLKKGLERRVAMLVMGRFADDVAKDFGTQEEDAVMADMEISGSGLHQQTDLLSVYRKAMGRVM